MKTIAELVEAALLLLREGRASAHPDVLEASGRLIKRIGATVESLAFVARAEQRTANTVHFSVGSGTPLHTSGFAQPVPPAPPPAPEPLPPQVVPGYEPPPDSVQCEEADQQRQNPKRIPALRSDAVLYLGAVHYYLYALRGQFQEFLRQTQRAPSIDGATAAHGTAFSDAEGERIDQAVLNIECLPGSCPAAPASEELRGTWQQTYDTLKELRRLQVLADDDEHTILFKMGNRPGGNTKEPDFTQPAPPPGPA